MGENQINIKSSTIEKALELAKEFLGKLISPSFEEVGLLLADRIKFFRFKNQVDILLKAQTYVNKKGIKVNEIPIKILVPLLENASLESTEEFQDKWANMIANMADSNSNLQNQIFPYILSQISIEEYNELKTLRCKELEFNSLRESYNDLIGSDNFLFNYETKKVRKEIDLIEQDGFTLNIEEYEIANLVRLGVIRQLPPSILIEEFKTGGERYSDEEWHQISAQYDPHVYGFRLTELGEKFLKLCE